MELYIPKKTIVPIENEDKLHVIIQNPENLNWVKYEIGVSANSVVTSGDYFRSFQIENKKYSHIINPKTCKTFENSVSSVTVIVLNGLRGRSFSYCDFGFRRSSCYRLNKSTAWGRWNNYKVWWESFFFRRSNYYI